MINYNNPNLNLQQPQANMMNGMVGQQQMQNPYGTNNMLLNNSPYDNYMGNRKVENQDLLSHQFLKCRPVSSKEQACACQIDLDGSLWVFTDIGNNKIYTKQINYDGTAAFNTYVLTKEKESSNQTDFVTKKEFNSVIQNLVAAMQGNHPQEPTAAKTNQTQLISF